MTKKDIGAILKTAISLFLICAVAAGLVALVNTVTAETIELNGIEEANKAKSAVLPAAESFEDVALADGSTGFVGKNAAGETVGYVFSSSANGYGGKVGIMTGFDTSGAVTGVQILDIEETPGLGMKAKESAFLDQFTGKTDELKVTKTGAPANDEIQALTSATITSRAMVKAVNAARLYFAEVTGKGE